MQKDKKLTSEEISHRAVSGVLVLIMRKAFLQGLQYLGSIILARVLMPDDFGIFAIVVSIITFFTFFSDVGIGAALIQKKDELKKHDLASTFTFQQVLVFIVVTIIYLISAPIANKYNLPDGGVWFIRVFSLSLFLTSLKTIPSILLERKLHFGKLVIPEMIEVIVFQVVAITLAINHFGPWSFFIALLVRGIIGTVTMYIISPWRISFAWDTKVVLSLIKFGVPFQMNGFIAMIKDSVLPIFVGAVSGLSAVGYLNWANTFSKLPILFMSDIFRVTFPTLSRIQDDKELLKKAVERTIRFINLILFPMVFILGATGRQIVEIIFTDKWLPALPAFYIHLTGILVVGVANVFMDTFWALGKTKLAVKLLILYTIINWGTAVPLVYLLGFNGAMIGAVIVLWVSLPINTYFIRKIIDVRIWAQIYGSLSSAILTGLITFYLSTQYVSDLLSLFAIAGFGGLLYLLFLLIIEKEKIIIDGIWLLKKAKIPLPKMVSSINIIKKHW